MRRRPGASARSARATSRARASSPRSVAFAGALLGLVGALPLLTGAAITAVRASAGAGAKRFDLRPVLALTARSRWCRRRLRRWRQLRNHLCAGRRAALGAALKLDFGKLAPMPGLKRMFGAEAAVAAARASMAFAAALVAVTPAGARSVAAAMTGASPVAAAGIAFAGMLQTCFIALAAGALFAFADYALVRRRWLHSLKMTFDEFKRDAKEQDGDPHAKSRRKQLHRTLVRGGIARTREASFVVVNPTHIAIGLRYAPPAVAVPEIVVRASDALALDVRALAERSHIPIVEDIMLARLLWQMGEAGRPIPAESFVAVATIIAALIRSGVLAA